MFTDCTVNNNQVFVYNNKKYNVFIDLVDLNVISYHMSIVQRVLDN